MNSDDLYRYWQLFTESIDGGLNRFEELVERIEAAAEKVAKAGERPTNPCPQPGDIVRRMDGPNFHLDEILEDGSRRPFDQAEAEVEPDLTVEAPALERLCLGLTRENLQPKEHLDERSRGAIWCQGLFGRWRRH